MKWLLSLEFFFFFGCLFFLSVLFTLGLSGEENEYPDQQHCNQLRDVNTIKGLSRMNKLFSTKTIKFDYIQPLFRRKKMVLLTFILASFLNPCLQVSV